MTRPILPMLATAVVLVACVCWLVQGCGSFGHRALGGDYLADAAPVTWAKNPVRYQIIGGTDEQRQITREALATWQEYLPFQLQEVDTDADTEIYIAPVETLLEAGMEDPSWWEWSPGDWGLDEKTGYATILNNEGYVRDDLSEEQMETAALHLAGHLWGMRGHSPVEGDLMHDTYRVGQGLTDRDIATIRLMYGGR